MSFSSEFHRPLHITQVNTRAQSGGAERIALSLHQAYRALGHQAELWVGHPPLPPQAKGISIHPALDHPWASVWEGLAERLRPYHFRLKGTWRVSDIASKIARPRQTYARWRGWERVYRPPFRPPAPTDILHLHNLHGGYFDLDQLPALSQRFHTVITLHDTWLLSGHCGFTNGCPRWQTGCGHCPDLTLYPALQRDATAQNWARKKALFAASRWHLIAPSQWMLDQVKASMLGPALKSARVIHNGVARSVFKPPSCDFDRAQVGLPTETKIALFSGALFGENPYKDYATIRHAMQQLAQRYQADRPLILVALGGGTQHQVEALSESVAIWSLPYQSDPQQVARYYQAADVFLHAAKSDNLPTTILEALACGVPVIATAVGGIPEQVDDLTINGPQKATGYLVASGDSAAMAAAIAQLLSDEDLRLQLGRNAQQVAAQRFDLDTQVQAHMDYYRAILEGQTSYGLA
jgi:glycosyltransferase involved in cell wall biosynthesis